MPQQARRGRQVAHVHLQPGVGQDPLSGLQAAQVRLCGAAGGLVGAREVAPQADDHHVPGVLGRPGGTGQGRQVRGDGPGPGHARVRLEVDARRPALGPGGGGHGVEPGRGGDGDVDTGGQGDPQGGAGGGGLVGAEHRQDPGQEAGCPGGGSGPAGVGTRDARLVQQLAQAQRLGELGHTEPGGARTQAGQGDGPQPVAVGVGLDHREPGRAGGSCQDPGVGGHGVEVDDGPGGRGWYRGRGGHDADSLTAYR